MDETEERIFYEEKQTNIRKKIEIKHIIQAKGNTVEAVKWMDSWQKTPWLCECVNDWV